jgi:hypothetical protein
MSDLATNLQRLWSVPLDAPGMAVLRFRSMERRKIVPLKSSSMFGTASESKEYFTATAARTRRKIIRNDKISAYSSSLW